MAKLCNFIHTANSHQVVCLRDITKISTDMLNRMKAFSKSRKLTLVVTDMSRFVSWTKWTLKAFKTIVWASVSRISDHKIVDGVFLGIRDCYRDRIANFHVWLRSLIKDCWSFCKHFNDHCKITLIKNIFLSWLNSSFYLFSSKNQANFQGFKCKKCCKKNQYWRKNSLLVTFSKIANDCRSDRRSWSPIMITDHDRDRDCKKVIDIRSRSEIWWSHYTLVLALLTTF